MDRCIVNLVSDIFGTSDDDIADPDCLKVPFQASNHLWVAEAIVGDKPLIQSRMIVATGNIAQKSADIFQITQIALPPVIAIKADPSMSELEAFARKLMSHDSLAILLGKQDQKTKHQTMVCASSD